LGKFLFLGSLIPPEDCTTLPLGKITQHNQSMEPFNTYPSDLPIPKEGIVRIREMTIDDFPKVFHIGEEIFTAEYSQSLYRTWDEYEITTLYNSDNELCLVAEAGTKILGFALGTTVEKHNSPWKYGYLVWLGVCPDIQQGGVGSELFKEIKRRMKEQGVRIIMIDTSADNRAAIRFFNKHGFDDVQEHVYMTLNLARKKKKKKTTQRKKQ
jgi:ribosomal protein S18 acetylase RimI-like enzyme